MWADQKVRDQRVRDQRVRDRRVRVDPGTVDVVTFEDLYGRELNGMLRLAYLMTSSGATAEEVVQDAFAKVYERWGSIEHPAAYLRTCVVNGCRRQLRRRKMAAVREPQAAAFLDPRGEMTEYLTDALASLSPKRRAAVVLRYFADLPEQEIADALGVRLGTVKSMLHRSLTELREVLA